MGKKGDKLTNQSNLAAEDLIAKLDAISGITSKKMFGGNGIFHDAKMFGIVNSKGECYFKVNDSTVHKYEEHGSSRHARMPYYAIPDSVLRDKDKLIEWAKKSIAISKMK